MHIHIHIHIYIYTYLQPMIHPNAIGHGWLLLCRQGAVLRPLELRETLTSIPPMVARWENDPMIQWIQWVPLNV